MVRQKISNLRQREGGFTIVELLIVIVVIGILAAITIIAYNGITTKANGTNSRSNAETVQKIAEAYNADNGAYPTFAQITTYNGSTKLPTSLVYVVAAAGGKTANSAVATAGALTTGAGLVDASNINNCVTATSLTVSCLGAANGTKDILYVANAGATGACIGFYDYSGVVGTAGTTQFVYAGAATAAGFASSVYSCT